MRLSWTRAQTILSIFVVLIVVSAGMFLYSTVIVPKQSKLGKIQEELTTEQTLLDTLKVKNDQQERLNVKSSRELQTLIPVNPLPDQLLLIIERAEGSSGSLIRNVTVESASSSEANTKHETGSEKKKETEQQALTSSPSILPEGLEAITYHLEVVSPNFQDFLSFLRELTTGPRLLSVDSISFDSEFTSVSEEKALDFSVVFSAFFYPSLDFLENEAPDYNYSEGAGKNNPFPYGENDDDDLNSNVRKDGSDLSEGSS
ncbi:hypothetical protein Q7A53_00935 [Halobacillus rhizosphaerae]|uniref:hypothetical protein n=1 Tax=Halobacillus rhizosphaerae TaxID=3064889 RepID=UPI00398ABC8A